MSRWHFVKPNDGKQCFAHGCPAYPTVHNGSELACRWHNRRTGKAIPFVTKTLREHWDLIRWHDALFNSTVVDFDMGEIHQRAPAAYKPMEGEQYWEYKARIRKIINDLLFPGPGKDA